MPLLERDACYGVWRGTYQGYVPISRRTAEWTICHWAAGVLGLEEWALWLVARKALISGDDDYRAEFAKGAGVEFDHRKWLDENIALLRRLLPKDG